MAAAKALLTAAGLLGPKKSTATEPATSSSLLQERKKSTATEPATKKRRKERKEKRRKEKKKRRRGETSSSQPEPDPLPLTGLQASASEDGFLPGDKDLEKIVALLLWMAKDFQSNIDTNDIHSAALEVISTGQAINSLHTASVAKLSELIDIMMLHKDGSPKDANVTLTFMRRVAKIREKLRPPWKDNATERVELDEGEVSLCYQRFGRILLTDDLLPHQKRDKMYRLRNNFEGDTYLSTFQRSFTDSMLRKFLGDKRVAFLIWQHGIPSIADNYRRVDSKVLDMGILQRGLNECLQWYTCLANNIVVHQTQEGFDAQLSASSLDEQEQQRQQTRREALQKARDALQLGAALAKQRDDRKRSYDDMNEDEQKTLEDYETGRTKRAKQRFTTPRMKPFRCKLQIND